MTPLTKIFVVLLVVLSVMSSAAMVVYVNRLAPMDQQLRSAQGIAAAAKAARDAAITRAAAAEADAQNEIKVAQGQGDAAAAVIANYQSQVNKLTLDLATANSNFTQQQALATRLTDTLKGANASIAQYTEQVKELREANDKLVRQAQDDSKSIADTQNANAGLTADLRYAREQLAALQDKSQKLGAALQNLGHKPEDVLAGNGVVGNGTGSAAISGVVRDRKTIDGITYVTLSVGSADGVQVNTTFNVLNSSGQFLGLVTVTSVDSTDSVGRLDGPADRVAMVKGGDNVRTQLRGS